MVSLTPEMAGNTIVGMVIMSVITFVYGIYMAYLGHKQAKVYKQMQEVIDILSKIELHTENLTYYIKKIKNKKLYGGEKK